MVLRDDPASVGGCLLATDRPLSQAAAGLADDKFPVKDVWPSARCSSSTSRTAILAIPGIGWATTVRGGQENSESEDLAVEGDDRKVLGHAKAAFMRSS